MENKIKVIIVSLTLIFISCSSSNEFGSRRNKYNLQKIIPNRDENAYQIIDTSKIYKLVKIKIVGDEYDRNGLNSMNEKNPSYFKFYQNGRIGEFRNINLNDIETFNPKKAQSHLYQLKNSKFIVQEYFKHPQCGECYIKKSLTKISENEIILSSENYIETYNKIEIPKKYLIYKPDWKKYSC